tara:strand:- start:2453 stop:3205 length:753 start_codon:yes stop_codon:yes gene_type:complete
VVDRVNRRYRDFVPGSSALGEIGVILHSIDGFEDPSKPWRACSMDPTSGCDFLSDRISASVIFKGKTVSFVESEGATYGKRGSYIIDPEATRLLCVYGGDGATRGKTCRPPGSSDRCIPACIPQYSGENSRNSYDRWCDSTSAADHWCSGRPWRPERIGEMLERDRLATQQGEDRTHGMTYNEVIVDGFHMNAQLPGSVEAFVASPGDDMDAVREVYHAWQREYPEAGVPLLAYHPERDATGRVFEVLSG